MNRPSGRKSSTGLHRVPMLPATGSQPIHGTLREHAGHPPTVEAQADPALASQERELGHSAAHFPVVPRAKECVGRPGRRLSQAKPHGPVQTVSIDGVEERIEPNRGRVDRDTEPHPGPEAPADLLESRGFEWPAQQWWHGIEQQRCSGHGQGLELLQGRLRDETAGEQHKAQPARESSQRSARTEGEASARLRGAAPPGCPTAGGSPGPPRTGARSCARRGANRHRRSCPQNSTRSRDCRPW